jgi:hypothetical protein
MVPANTPPPPITTATLPSRLNMSVMVLRDYSRHGAPGWRRNRRWRGRVPPGTENEHTSAAWSEEAKEFAEDRSLSENPGGEWPPCEPPATHPPLGTGSSCKRSQAPCGAAPGRSRTARFTIPGLRTEARPDLRNATASKPTLWPVPGN